MGRCLSVDNSTSWRSSTTEAANERNGCLARPGSDVSCQILSSGNAVFVTPGPACARVGVASTRFERFCRSCCGTTECLPLRVRLSALELRVVALRTFARCSRLQLIDRISSNMRSQSSICEANTARFGLRAVNKWKRDLAARIAFNEFDSLYLNRPPL